MQVRQPDPLQLAPKLKSAPLPSKLQLNLTAEAGVPADMISAYLPQREQQQSENPPTAGRGCGQVQDACEINIQQELLSGSITFLQASVCSCL